MSDTSSLARELGAIASGETWVKHIEAQMDRTRRDHTDAFAAGIVRLIDERIAAAMGGAEHGPSSCVDAKPDIRIGDTVDHGPGSAVYEVTQLANSGSVARLSGDGAWDNKWVSTFSLADPHHGWRVVRAADVPKAAEPVEVGDRFRWLPPSRFAGQVGTVVKTDGIGSAFFATGDFTRWFGVITLNDPAQFKRMPRADAEPAPGVVVIGDMFLRLTPSLLFHVGGIAAVTQFHGADEQYPFTITCRRTSATERVSEACLLHSGHWQRVPAGYTLPTAMEFHAATRRLLAARDAMAADPTTGTAGIDECIAQMARMAGMAVPT